MNKFHRIRNAATASLLVLLAACAASPEKKGDAVAAPANSAQAANGIDVSTDPKAPLPRRATDRWKLLIAKDAARAFTYLTPGYRATMTSAQYEEWLRTRQIRWTQGKYVDHHCSEPTACVVSIEVSIETKVPGIPGVQASSGVVEESWLQIDGVWYHLPTNVR